MGHAFHETDALLHKSPSVGSSKHQIRGYAHRGIALLTLPTQMSSPFLLLRFLNGKAHSFFSEIISTLKNVPFLDTSHA